MFSTRNGFHLRAMASPWWRGVTFLLREYRGPSDIVEFDGAAWIKIEPTEPAVEREPSFSLRMDEAQTLMDDLWNCGLRPTEGAGSAGSLRATEKHLADMRKIVFMYVGRGAE
jgi:hypothetical protein